MNETHPLPVLHSVAQVAARLNVHRVTAWEWIRAGKLSAVRVGRSFAVPAAELDRVVRDFGKGPGE
jgi:excisionase family DNA binding protein